MNLKSLVPSLSGVLKTLVAVALINTVAKRVPIVGRVVGGF